MHKTDVIALLQNVTSPADIAVDLGIPAPCVEIDGLPFGKAFQAVKICCLRRLHMEKTKQQQEAKVNKRLTSPKNHQIVSCYLE